MIEIDPTTPSAISYSHPKPFISTLPCPQNSSVWTCAAFPILLVLQNCPTAKLDSAETEVWQPSQKPEGLTNLILELISSTYCGNQLSHILYEDLGIQYGTGMGRLAVV